MGINGIVVMMMYGGFWDRTDGNVITDVTGALEILAIKKGFKKARQHHPSCQTTVSKNGIKGMCILCYMLINLKLFWGWLLTSQVLHLNKKYIYFSLIPLCNNAFCLLRDATKPLDGAAAMYICVILYSSSETS